MHKNNEVHKNKTIDFSTECKNKLVAYPVYKAYKKSFMRKTGLEKRNSAGTVTETEAERIDLSVNENSRYRLQCNSIVNNSSMGNLKSAVNENNIN